MNQVDCGTLLVEGFVLLFNGGYRNNGRVPLVFAFDKDSGPAVVLSTWVKLHAEIFEQRATHSLGLLGGYFWFDAA